MARAGVDITREREKSFPNRRLLELPEMEAATKGEAHVTTSTRAHRLPEVAPEG